MADTDKFSDSEILARTIYGEARNQGTDGICAVANVIMNRVKLNGWRGHDVRSVCLKPFQFSCWNQSDPNRAKIMAVTTADPIYEQCLEIAGAAIAGTLPDIVGNADSYQVINTGAYWSKGLTPVATIIDHEFYVT